MNILEIPKVKPFLRWAGGKSWLIKSLSEYLPEKFNNYHEPFLGGGSIFIHLKTIGLINKEVYLSDFNHELINSYCVIRDSIDELIMHLKKYRNTEKNYYSIRNKIFEDPVIAAARFIFLNKTSFNGIYRENLKGEYNVPYGYKNYTTLFDYENLMQLSKLLQNSTLSTEDFALNLRKAKKGDLVFLDPPYTVAHENNGFVKYNQKIFSWDDQVRLKECIEKLDSKGVYYILTNAYHKSILNLYKGVGNSIKLQRYSVVGGAKAKREIYNEILITNV